MDWLLPAAVVGSSLLGAGASLLGGNRQAQAAERASDTAAQQAAAQNELNWRIYQQNRTDFAPWREAGGRGLTRLEQLVNVPFEASPGYQFRMEEGARAIDRGMNAQGLYGSGARAKALMRYGQGLAGEEYGNYMNRLAALAGIGQTATGATAQAGMPLMQSSAPMNAAQVAAMQNAGTASGGGIVGAGNAAMGGINNMLALYALGWMGGGGGRVPMPNPNAITFYPGQGGY